MIKLCQKSGNGICLECSGECGGEICRKTAQDAVNFINELIKMDTLTDEQKDILNDFDQLKKYFNKKEKQK